MRPAARFSNLTFAASANGVALAASRGLSSVSKFSGRGASVFQRLRGECKFARGGEGKKPVSFPRASFERTQVLPFTFAGDLSAALVRETEHFYARIIGVRRRVTCTPTHTRARANTARSIRMIFSLPSISQVLWHFQGSQNVYYICAREICISCF